MVFANLWNVLVYINLGYHDYAIMMAVELIHVTMRRWVLLCGDLVRRVLLGSWPKLDAPLFRSKPLVRRVRRRWWWPGPVFVAARRADHLSAWRVLPCPSASWPLWVDDTTRFLTEEWASLSRDRRATRRISVTSRAIKSVGRSSLIKERLTNRGGRQTALLETLLQ